MRRSASRSDESPKSMQISTREVRTKRHQELHKKRHLPGGGGQSELHNPLLNQNCVCVGVCPLSHYVAVEDNCGEKQVLHNTALHGVVNTVSPTVLKASFSSPFIAVTSRPDLRDRAGGDWGSLLAVAVGVLPSRPFPPLYASPSAALTTSFPSRASELDTLCFTRGPSPGIGVRVVFPS